MGVKESENIRLIPSLRIPSRKTNTTHHHQVRRISSPGLIQTSTRPFTPSSVLKNVNKHREDQNHSEIIVPPPSIVEPQNNPQEVLVHKLELVDDPAVIGSGAKLDIKKTSLSSSSGPPSEVFERRPQTPSLMKPDGTILLTRPSSSPRPIVPMKHLSPKSASPNKDPGGKKPGTQAYAGPKFMNSPPPTELPLPRFALIDTLENGKTSGQSEPIGGSGTEFIGHQYPIISPQPSPSSGHEIRGGDSMTKKEFRSKPRIAERNLLHRSPIPSTESNRTPEGPRTPAHLSSSNADTSRMDSELARLSLDFKTFLISGQTSSPS
jgi:hypothetical protein